MQGHERDLHAEAEDDERERRVAPGRSRQRGDDVANLHAAVRLARRQHDEGDQQHRLAEQRKRHIDAARAARCGLLVMRDKVIGGHADQRVDEVEGQKVGGDEHAETAGHREQPRDRKAVGVRPPLPFAESEEADDEPDERRREEQQAAGLIEPEAHAQRRQLGAERRAANRERSGCKRGRGGERRDRARQAAQAGREEEGENDERRRQRCDQQGGTELLRQRAHCSARPAAGRPICRKAKNDGGANASRRATSARASAMLSRLRAGVFFSCGLSPESAGASTR